MPFDAKIVDPAKNVSTVTFPTDDPTDVELIAALGGGADVDIHPVGDVEPWAVLKLSGGTDRLIIGKWSHGDGPSKRRITCDITDAEAVRIANFW
ncbi:hypothetical protein HJB89_25290 [Rhizobium sp. NZLR8]|uniref:hypothetical protein n=1 Tax=Rhizobium sp. NZLR8 TaxID=2731104 RepID=UPI001C83B22A|nr:hypothetical protein [Rhizobium sp. NZLR8]MBX5160402.1 hypothetical protein [Rhizobium sp. NZLR8]